MTTGTADDLTPSSARRQNLKQHFNEIPMDSQEKVIKECVLQSVANDYECFDTILGQVTEWAIQDGFRLDSQMVQRALEQLIEDGHVQAYVLSAVPPGKAQATEFTPERTGELWFYLTAKGRQAVSSLS